MLTTPDNLLADRKICGIMYVVRKALTADRLDQRRYRIGDHRLICRIEDSELVILAPTVGHRKEVYS